MEKFASKCAIGPLQPSGLAIRMDWQTHLGRIHIP